MCLPRKNGEVKVKMSLSGSNLPRVLYVKSGDTLKKGDLFVSYSTTYCIFKWLVPEKLVLHLVVNSNASIFLWTQAHALVVHRALNHTIGAWWYTHIRSVHLSCVWWVFCLRLSIVLNGYLNISRSVHVPNNFFSLT